MGRLTEHNSTAHAISLGLWGEGAERRYETRTGATHRRHGPLSRTDILLVELRVVDDAGKAEVQKGCRLGEPRQHPQNPHQQLLRLNG